MERNNQQNYSGAYGQARDDRFHENREHARFGDRQQQTWNRPVGEDGNHAFGRDRHTVRRESDYNRNYNNDYNRNYNNDYNQEYNSYHLYRRNHSHDRDSNRNSGGAEQRTNFGARAQGDYSGGTHYGEGGSTYGGGSGYGHSYYGPSGNQGNRHEQGNYRAENVQNGYGNFRDSDNRNYGSYGGFRNDELQQDYRSGANTGYNRGNAQYNPTGYGTTRYNNRDEDRARSAGNNDAYIRSRYRDDYHREV
ncbi:hypothetical protein [Pontibacter chitinilyticus]|uniref:hypothetical protein n=1 Tax=Pontibacter chitinilyticus TaxID=2674989 RepID=UPI00321BDEB2